jgi:hypothetical protein
MIRASLLAVLSLAAMTLPLEAQTPNGPVQGAVQGTVKGTAKIGQGVVQGTGQATAGVARGTGTVAKDTGKGVWCFVTLGYRC